MKSEKIKRVVLLLPFWLIPSAISFQSCEKMELIEGHWFGERYEIIFTPSKDFVYVDQTGSPWTGELSVTVNGVTETLSELYFGADNISLHKSEGGLVILFFNDGILIDYKAEKYFINKDYSFSYWDGEFSINTSAISNNSETIVISGALSAPKIECKKGIEYTVNDRLYRRHLKLIVLYILEDNKLLCLVEDDDCEFRGDGTWKGSGQSLDLKYTLYDFYAENVDYQNSVRLDYSLGSNNELVLIETIENLTDNEILDESFFGFEPGIFSQLKYRITFEETDDNYF